MMISGHLSLPEWEHFEKGKGLMPPNKALQGAWHPKTLTDFMRERNK